MPCYDDRHTYEEGLQSGRSEAQQSNREVDELRRGAAFLEAALCALMNELKVRGIAHEVVQTASRHGLIDIISYWEHHNKSDETRLAKELHKYSIHEQDILKKLLSHKDKQNDIQS